MSAALITGATTPVGAAIAKQLLPIVSLRIIAVGAEPFRSVPLFPSASVTYLQADLTLA